MMRSAHRDLTLELLNYMQVLTGIIWLTVARTAMQANLCYGQAECTYCMASIQG